MKKAVSILLLLIVTVSLTSCTVNWFGDTADVPWYVIAIPLSVIFVLAYIMILSKTYICPHCKTEFKAKPYQLYVTIHMGNKRIAKCPQCGRRGFCEIKKSK